MAQNVYNSILRPVLRQYFLKPCHIRSTIAYSTESKDTRFTQWEMLNRKQKVSKAMEAYLERAHEHDTFMKKQQFEYDAGKRHLANMMGEDPETFSQKDVDRAIEYLFPSGIYDPAARPLMKPPEEVFPARKAAEFDAAGRPYHFLFYTTRPNFFKLLYDAVEFMNNLYAFQDGVTRRKVDGKQFAEPLDPHGSAWITKQELEDKLVERLEDLEYENFTSTMDRLMALPYSAKYKDFIYSYRNSIIQQSSALAIPEPGHDQNGRAFVTTYECLRKAARGHVTIRSPGTGKITINGKDLSYFKDIYCREQMIFPLIFTGLQESVDVECHVEHGGPSGQAGAMRWGIAWSLRSFVDADMVQRMHVAGLLTRDRRRRERKLPGQPGARRQPTWKKR